jgi:hypothetical protein
MVPTSPGTSKWPSTLVDLDTTVAARSFAIAWSRRGTLGTPGSFSVRQETGNRPTYSFLSIQASESIHLYGVDVEIQSLPPLSPWATQSKASTFETWNPYPIPEFPDDVVVRRWKIVAAGAHGQIRCAQVQRGEEITTLCFKLFTEDWRNAYEREVDAYALMLHRRVRQCIPDIYFKAAWSRKKWDGDQPSYEEWDLKGQEQVLYGLVMEYFDDCQEIKLWKANVPLVKALGQSFERILDAMVIHNDIYERNILLVRESGKVRVVWIDFSCAWTGTCYSGARPSEWDMFRGFLQNYVVSWLCCSFLTFAGSKCTPLGASGRVVSCETGYRFRCSVKYCWGKLCDRELLHRNSTTLSLFATPSRVLHVFLVAAY